MMLENHPLTALNTLGLTSEARYFVRAERVEQLQAACAFAREHNVPIVPLGGGSNMVLGQRLDAVVVQLVLKGKRIIERIDDRILVEAQAGEPWHDFVLWTIAQQAYGLENLSLIPGTVGACPIQNIGAYGVEISDHFERLTALETATGELHTFTAEQCRFGYRDSVFKGELKDRFIITSVVFALDAILQPQLGYGPLKEQLNEESSAQQISDVVCAVRSEKLPDPRELGNAGSFFKNPQVSAEAHARLLAKFPSIVAHPVGNEWKLAAGWLIDQAGLKGIREGALGTYPKQALVLVNYGKATGPDVAEFAARIAQVVWDKFGVQLEAEPRFYAIAP